MGWFGGSSDNDTPQEKSFASDDGAAFASAPVSAAAGGGMNDIQSFGVGLQQQLLVQQVITDLSDRAFIKCIQSCKDSELSGKEVACIQAATNKWLDTNEYMAGRIQKKGQQMMQHQQQQFG